MTHSFSPGYILGALYLLTALGPAAAKDSAVHLATSDPGRAPSPAIGNGRIGVVIPALGFGPGESFVAGIYDVPRIAAVPSWTAISVSDGTGWLDSSAVAAGQVRARAR